MAIKFEDEAPAPRREPVKGLSDRLAGEARFATPVETTQAVNADAASELPFVEPPPAAKTKRKRRT